jgi:hypothetical protein
MPFVFSMLTSSPLFESGGTVATTATLQLWTDNKAVGQSEAPVASGPCTLLPLPDGGANVTCTVQDNSVEPGLYVAVVNSTSTSVGVPVITMTPPPLPDTSVELEFTSPTNGRRGVFRLVCSYPASKASFEYSFLVPAGGVQNTTQATPLVLNFEGWVDGVYNLRVACFGRVGKDFSAAIVSWELDYTPPNTTVISAHPSALSASSAATFVFKCSDGPGRCSFVYLLDAASQWTVVGWVARRHLRSALSKLTISPVTLLNPIRTGGAVSTTCHVSFTLSGAPDVGTSVEYRIFSRVKLPLLNAASWKSLPAGSVAVAAKLHDATYLLQMRFWSGESMQYAAREFSVITSVPSTQIKDTSAGQGVQQVSVEVGVVGGAKAEALQFSLDGAAYVRVNCSNVSLTGLAPGPHRLKVKAENEIGETDQYPRILHWRTRETSETEPLYVTPSPLSPSEFEVGGWFSDHYKWRLDGSPWTEAKESRSQFHTVSPNVMHFWEALPATDEAVWSGPPLVYAWSVGAGGQHGRSLLLRDELTLTELLDGNHTLLAKAVDAAGMLTLACLCFIVFT